MHQTVFHVFLNLCNQRYTMLKQSIEQLFGEVALITNEFMSVLMNSVPPVLMKIVPLKKRFNKINNVYFLVI